MAHTGFDQTVREFGRIDTNVRKSLVDEVLPEHFREDYPKLITFLDGYYEHLDSADNFGGIIQELQTIRDIEDTKLEYLDNLFGELALGVSQGQFKVPREAIRNFGNFFRVKGTQYSAHGFFRGFFDETVEIIHPRDRLFIVGESKIGQEEAKRLQDGALNQFLSILIRSAIPLVQWEELYRNFVHPAGFFLGAEVVIEGLPQVEITTDSSLVDNLANTKLIFSTDSFGMAAQGEAVGMLTGFSEYSPNFDGLDSDAPNLNALQYVASGYYAPNYAGDSLTYALRDRYSLYRNLNDYDSAAAAGTGTASLTITTLMKYYDTLYEWAGFYQSFDDFADSSNASAIRFSATFDDFSQAVYFRK